MKEYENKRILVTGGTGLIGRAVVKLLCDAGARVTSVSLDSLDLDTRVEYVQADLRSFEHCRIVTEDMDYVFHIAGIKASPDITNRMPATMSIPALMVNTNILEACRVNHVGKVLFTSSIGAYEQADVLKEENAYKGNPMDFLPGHVKRMAEFQIQGYAKEYKDNKFVIVRLANCYGPGDNFDPENAMVIPSLMAKIYRGDDPVLIWGDGTAKRDLVYSEDVARGILQMMLNVTDSYPINLGSGTEYRIWQVAQVLKEITSFNCKFDPSKPSGAPRRFMDISRAREFDYNPETSLHDGLKLTWDWYITHSDEYKLKQNYFKGEV